MAILKRCNQSLDEFEPPPKINSEADLLIKELAKQQQNTTVDLHQQLAHPKEFTKGSELISLSRYNAGCSSLEEFKESISQCDNISFLKDAGLTEEEIELYVEYQKGENLSNRHRNCERSILDKHIEQIKESVLKHRRNILSTHSNPDLLNSNTKFDSGLKVTQTSNAIDQHTFASETKHCKEKCNIEHPMNHIKDIEQNFLKSISVEKLPPINKIRRKARKLQNRINASNGDSKFPVASSTNNGENFYVVKSQWDKKTQPPVQQINKPKQLYTCTPQNYYTIKDGAIVKLSNSECKERNLPCTEQLTVDKIKELPKFKDYEKGDSSKVLYLKNLSNTVSETDIKNLFKHYEETGEVKYKLMHGKMRGQAFVTFADEVVALQALENVNGMFLKNKPVIIQFGHGKG